MAWILRDGSDQPRGVFNPALLAGLAVRGGRPLGLWPHPRDILTKQKGILSQIVAAVQAGTPMTVQGEGLPFVRKRLGLGRFRILLGKSILG